MASTSLYELPTPDTFPFPFPPYDIQLQLMKHIFASLEHGRIALVESPTGTGKSFSLITATLSWLAANESRVKTAALDDLRARLAEQLEGEPKWVIEGELERKRRDLERQEQELEERIRAIREREAKERKARERKEAENGHIRKKQKISHESVAPSAKQDDDDAFAPEDIADEDQPDDDGMSPALRELMKRYRGRPNALVDVEEEPDVTKVYYASRTHSQLSQFMGEIRKTAFSTARTIPLGSRSNLCINDEVKKASKGVEDLNERCLDLQKKGKDRCPFLPAHDDPTPLNDFRDHALSGVHAIEDLEDLGQRHKVCPYYGARRSIRQSQLVALPYQMLLSKSARDSLGVSLKDQIVVIDEAHALIDTILNTHTVTVTSSAIASALAGCQVYQSRFVKQLKGVNAANLKLLHSVLTRIDRFCTEWKGGKEEMRTSNEVVKALGLDQVPLRKLDAWIKEAKMARKISGYAETLEQREQAKQLSSAERKANRAASVSMFHRLQAFLLALTEAERDGRIIISLASATPRVVSLKYLLLNPEEMFRDIVEEARAVVLAGGTMAPMRDFEQQLFSYVGPTRLANLTCSHVVPAEHLLVRTLGVGPSGAKLELKYEARGDNRIIDELGLALVNLAAVVHAGCVCFFPSYGFLDSALARWKEKGLLERLGQEKQVFTEPKASGETEGILRSFATACSTGSRGGILLAVVGAKLSEGINFSDDLCRCVVVISVPYPSLASLELRERMAYVTAQAKARDGNKAVDAGKILYSNLAFRAVNQAIGRAIRHRNDWAAIILLDARYANPSAQQLLPAWIRGRLEVAPTFGSALKSVAGFMKSRRAAPVPA